MSAREARSSRCCCLLFASSKFSALDRGCAAGSTGAERGACIRDRSDEVGVLAAFWLMTVPEFGPIPSASEGPGIW